MPDDPPKPIDKTVVSSDAPATPSDKTVSSPLTPDGTVVSSGGRVASAAAERPDRIGRYRIVRVLGEGGMGTVYEALQDEPERTVALKVMKSGMTSPSALKRFQYESQILGRLRHPGIAQVYEAGTHDDGSGGVPYFVMEFILGAQVLTDYADIRQLDTRGRLELFMQVCDAVHYGHQKGVIHRDLKPGNILVDQLGQPKIIDFGIARVTDSDVARTTIQTQVGQLVGTVQYMSPEQCLADPDDIDTRSDVYALGIVLYELLCGKLPYDVTQVPIFEATRVIREMPPTPLAPLRSELKGDVQTIVFKALEKDRERRYQSANALGADIDRYLHHQPIVARPPSTMYQLRMFSQRNKALVGGIAGVAVALVVGIVGTTWQWRQATASARTANKITGFYQQMFTSLGERARGYGPEMKVADMLDDATEEVGIKMADEPEVLAGLRWSLGNGYKGLGRYDEAETQLRLALDSQRDVLDPDDPRIADTLMDLASTLYFRTEYAEAEEHYAEALRLRRRLYGDVHEDVATSLRYLAASIDKQDRHAEAETLYRKSLALNRELWGEDHDNVARCIANLATCLMSQKEYVKAEQYVRRSLEMSRRLHGDEHVDVGSGLSNLGYCLLKDERPREAEQKLRQALPVKEKHFGARHVTVAGTLHWLAEALREQDRCDEAESHCRLALSIREERLSATHTLIISSLDQLRAILLCRDDVDADALHSAWSRVETIIKTLVAAERSKTALTLTTRWDEAIRPRTEQHPELKELAVIIAAVRGDIEAE